MGLLYDPIGNGKWRPPNKCMNYGQVNGHHIEFSDSDYDIWTNRYSYSNHAVEKVTNLLKIFNISSQKYSPKCSMSSLSVSWSCVACCCGCIVPVNLAPPNGRIKYQITKRDIVKLKSRKRRHIIRIVRGLSSIGSTFRCTLYKRRYKLRVHFTVSLLEKRNQIYVY